MNDYYWKKPVRIQAWRIEPGKYPPHWLVQARVDGTILFDSDADNFPTATIRTLEGTMKANTGDWIIKGVQGELYPCKDIIFRATYTDHDPTK